MKKQKAGLAIRRLEFRKSSIMSLSAAHAYMIKGGDETGDTKAPAPPPPQLPIPPNPPPPNTRESREAGCTIAGN